MHQLINTEISNAACKTNTHTHALTRYVSIGWLDDSDTACRQVERMAYILCSNPYTCVCVRKTAHLVRHMHFLIVLVTTCACCWLFFAVHFAYVLAFYVTRTPTKRAHNVSADIFTQPRTHTSENTHTTSHTHAEAFWRTHRLNTQTAAALAVFNSIIRHCVEAHIICHGWRSIDRD